MSAPSPSSMDVGPTEANADVRDICLYREQPESSEARIAIGRLMQRYRPMVFACVIRIVRDVASADDLIQEVQLHALHKLNTLRNPAAFSSWLRVMARRMALNLVAREKGLLSLHPEMEILDTRSPDRSSLEQEERSALLAAVASLRPLDRDMLQRHYLNQQPILRIAEELHVPLGTIKRRLHTARGRLLAVLAQHPLFADVESDAAG